MAGPAVLKITDGTNSVDILDIATEGFNVDGWRYALADHKGGGAWSESALSDGRRLIDFHYGNVQQSIPLDISVGSQDSTIANLRRLKTLLEDAAKYWVDEYNDTPVWLERRSPCETNISYHYIYRGHIPDLGDLFHDPFNPDGVLDDLVLQLEHSLPMSHAPGDGVATNLSAREEYGGKGYGNVDSTGARQVTTGKVYSAGLYAQSQITHIYHYDASAGAWAGNLQGGAVPYGLFPNPLGINDVVYFGIDSTAANASTFNSLVFDIGTTIAACSGHFQQWTGAWTASNVNDNTGSGYLLAGSIVPFLNTGVNSIHWNNLATWTTGNLQTIFGGGAPNVTAWWVRIILDVAAPAQPPPTQQNRDVYVIRWPYLEVQSSEVDGDAPARLKIKLIGASSDSQDQELMALSKVMMGLRDVDRGANFMSRLNASSLTNPPNVTCSVTTGAFATDTGASGGESITWTPGGLGTFTICDWDIVSPSASHYTGLFHAFGQVFRDVGTADNVSWRLKLYIGDRGTMFAQTPEVFIGTQAGSAGVADWKTVSIPGRYPVDSLNRLKIRLEATVYNVGGETYKVDSAILIPVDQWACDIQAPNADVSGCTDVEVYVDSLTRPKQFIRTYADDIDSVPTELTAHYTTRANGFAQFEEKKQQRLFFWMAETSTTGFRYRPVIALYSQIERVQTYLVPRGDE